MNDRPKRLAGYSGTPLPRKLGVNPGSRVMLVGAPEELVTDMTEDVVREVALPTGLVDNKVCARHEVERPAAGPPARAAVASPA